MLICPEPAQRLLLLLLLFLPLLPCTRAAPGVFDNYHQSPPSPEQGPPASANASRDKSLLPAQICGLVGGYVATVFIWGVLLLTVGRKMRRKTENSPRTLELQLVTATPSGNSVASPRSARSATSWFRKGFRKSDVPADAAAAGHPDSPVVNSPSSFDQKVIEADRDRAQAEMERLYAAVMEHDRKKSSSQVSMNEQQQQQQEIELDPRRPSRINTSHGISQSNPSSPVRAIYPPGYAHNGPPTAPLPRDRSRDQQPPASPRSILSKKSTASSSSRARFNLKNLRISNPVQKYPGERDDEEARTPLSPRSYHLGGQQTSPSTQQTSPTTPATIEEQYEQLDRVQPLPRPAPQRAGSSSHAPTTPPLPTLNKAASSSNQELPLRGYAEPLKSPDLRTTVLDRRLDKLSLTTPKTGVPYTPYSPYMPFTPLTPVTPHLVTKTERKERKKWGRKLAAREDMVQSPKEIFGDAY